MREILSGWPTYFVKKKRLASASFINAMFAEAMASGT